MHAQTCHGLPCSVRYMILTVAAKCRHAWVKHYNTKFRINLFSVSRNVSCVQTDRKMKMAIRRAATGANITPLPTLPNTSILPSILQQYVILFRPTFIPLSTRNDVTRVLISTSDVSSCMHVTLWVLDYNTAERCPRQLCLALTTGIAKSLIKHKRIRTYNTTHSPRKQQSGITSAGRPDPYTQQERSSGTTLCFGEKNLLPLLGIKP